MWRLVGRTAVALAPFASALVLALSPSARAQVATERISFGLLQQPIYATHAPGRPDDLFVVEREGDIWILNLPSNSLKALPFLTVSDVSTEVEGGLTSIAFHPDYESNGLFYTISTSSGIPSLTSHVREYSVSSNPDLAETAFTTILSVSQPQANNNGGWIGFSPTDTASYLYITFGDGGASNDSGAGHTPLSGNAQDITDNLLGKILRIDVDGDDFPADPDRNYAIPPTNPFVDLPGDDEIWAYGLRNPFRASFDRLTGDLYIGDVGQDSREEINFQPQSSLGGENYGWRLREGTVATPTGGVGGGAPPGAIDPIYEYLPGSGDFLGDAVTGGYLYSGPVADLQGLYVFGDYMDDNFWAFDPADPDGTVMNINDWLVPDQGSIETVASFAEDAAGNLYLLDLGDGELFRVVPEPASPVLLLTGLASLFALSRRRANGAAGRSADPGGRSGFLRARSGRPVCSQYPPAAPRDRNLP